MESQPQNPESFHPCKYYRSRLPAWPIYLNLYRAKAIHFIWSNHKTKVQVTSLVMLLSGTKGSIALCLFMVPFHGAFSWCNWDVGITELIFD